MDNKRLVLTLDNNEVIEFISENTIDSGFTFSKNEYNNNYYFKINYNYLNVENTSEIFNFYESIQNEKIVDIKFYLSDENNNILDENGNKEEMLLFSSEIKKLKSAKVKYDEGFNVNVDKITATILFEFI